MTSALKRLICRVLVGVLLATQFAVAAYACSGFGTQPRAGEATAAVALSDLPSANLSQADPVVSQLGMMDRLIATPDGESGRLDPTHPNLCIAHCQFGQQSADHTPAPAPFPVLLTALYSLPPGDGETRLSATPAAYRATVPGDPPHAILHCCFRD